jgi:oligopeptide/dipeptide ABC transporter ATP-binding protein
MNNEVLLEARELEKNYPGSLVLPWKRKFINALHKVNLQIFKGETLGLVGESGCGKSTLGDILLGLVKPSAGKVSFLGKDIFSMPREELRKFRRHMQMVFQDPYSSLNPRMTVRELVESPLDVFHEGIRKERDLKVEETLALTGLGPESLHRYPHEFSGGQRQRIGLARAIILNPEFVVCDEPVSALDVSVRSQIINLLEDLQDQLGLTYLFISHDLSVVHHIARRTAVMYLGEILEIAGRAELFKRPQHPYTRALLSSIPIPDRRVKRSPVMMTGFMPNVYEIPAGCRFNTRCPFVQKRCREESPVLAEVAPEHFTACHLDNPGAVCVSGDTLVF